MWRPNWKKRIWWGLLALTMALLGVLGSTVVSKLDVPPARPQTAVLDISEVTPVSMQQGLGSVGICIHAMVVFPNADSVGIAWSPGSCNDLVDVRRDDHWAALEKSTAHLPGRCGIIFRLPGLPAPVVDTLPGPLVCSYSDLYQPLIRRASL